MNLRLLGLLCLVLSVFLIGSTLVKSEAREDNQGGAIQGKNDTGCIEVVEAKGGGQSCTDAKGISLRLKVNCDKPVDIRISYKNKRDRWENVTYKNKNKGDEISFADCYGFAPYKIMKRDAGSTKDFPNP